MKRCIVGSLSAAFFCLACCGLTLADNRKFLRFEVSLEKSAYLLDEPIYLEMLTTNTSDEEIATLPMRLGSSWEHFAIHLKDQNGKVLDYKGVNATMIVYPNWPGLIMAKTEKLLLVVDLLDNFGEMNDHAHQIKPYLSPGSYTIQVIYHTNPKFITAEKPWQEDKQTLYSDILKFDVVESSGLERAAHETLLAGLTEHSADSRNPVKAISLFKKLIAKYPNSVYQPVAYSFLDIIYMHTLGDLTEGQKLIEEALIRLPNNGVIYELLHDERFDEIRSLAVEKTLTKPMMLQTLNIMDGNSKASFYAQCLVEMTRSQMRGEERMKK